MAICDQGATTSDEEFTDNSAEESDAALQGTTSSEDHDGVMVNHVHNHKLPADKMMRVALIALFSAVGSTLFGLDIGYIGPIIESQSFKHDVEHTQGEVDSFTEGLIVSLFSVGAICTAFPVVSSFFLDYYGRKVSIMVGSFVFIVGSIIQLSAWGKLQLFIGRFVAGMSIGLLSSVIVLYQSEVAPANMRGALSTLYQLGITFGILLAAFIDQMIVDKHEGWRMVMGIICLPAIFLIAGMVFLPRSPRWLVQQGKRKEALKVLLTIRSEEEAVKEEEEIHQEIQKSIAEGEPLWSELLHGRIFQLLTLGITLQLLQQLVGMNAFMYFGPKIFKSIGFSKNLFTTITNFVNFLATFPAVFLADRAGRRSLMLWSSIGMTIACTLMGVMGLLYLEQVEPGVSSTNTTIVAGNVTTVPNEEETWTVTNDWAGWVIAFSAFFFVFNFAFGFGPIVWVYCAEIFPLRYRARALGVTTVGNWVGNFMIAQFTPMLLSSIHFSTFFVFGFFCFIGAFLSAWLPETKGVPLESIQGLFDRKAWFRNTAEGKVKTMRGIELLQE